jgi:hypothetical protein
MSAELIYGQYGAIACLIFAVVHLYRENTQLRKDAMDLLKKYQDRDEEERRWRVEQERNRSSAERRRSSEAE